MTHNGPGWETGCPVMLIVTLTVVGGIVILNIALLALMFIFVGVHNWWWGRKY
jgi:hypothetical protein